MRRSIFLDHNHADAARVDLGQQALQSRALQRAAGETAVVEAVGVSFQPSWRWLATWVVQASCCASSELKA